MRSSTFYSHTRGLACSMLTHHHPQLLPAGFDSRESPRPGTRLYMVGVVWGCKTSFYFKLPSAVQMSMHIKQSAAVAVGLALGVRHRPEPPGSGGGAGRPQVLSAVRAYCPRPRAPAISSDQVWELACTVYGNTVGEKLDQHRKPRSGSRAVILAR